MFRKLKKLWNAFLLRLTKENQVQFGSKRTDCCELNKPRHEK